MRNTIPHLILPVLNTAGPVLMAFAVTTLVPLFVAVVYDPALVKSFVIGTGVTFITGLLLSILTRHEKTERTARHGFLLVTLIWTLIPLFSTIPFLLELPKYSFPKLYFEMMSCLSTTGATVMTGLDKLPLSLNGFRCFLSWLGGMGIIVLSVAILPLLGVGGAQIIKAETSGPLKEEKLTPRIADTAKALYIIYFGISFACAIAYHLAGMEWQDAIMHMMTTVSLSGISSHDASYVFFHSARIDYVASFFMVLCGLNFSLHFVCWSRRNVFLYLKDPEALSWLLTLITLVGLTFYILYSQHIYRGWEENFRYALFSVISVASTTGYADTDYSSWPYGLPFILLFAACFATCAGSTGGGIKQIRLLILSRQLKRELMLLLYPKAAVPLRVGEMVIDNKISFAVLVYVMVWSVTIIIGAMILLLTGLAPLEAFSASIATITNLGPGLGDVGPAGNFAHLSSIQLWICSALMLLGRLEIFTVFVLFTRNFWKI